MNTKADYPTMHDFYRDYHKCPNPQLIVGLTEDAEGRTLIHFEDESILTINQNCISRIAVIENNKVHKRVNATPYITKEVTTVTIERSWNPLYDPDAICICGDTYVRHFDPYNKMEAVGCKYCRCDEFRRLG